MGNKPVKAHLETSMKTGVLQLENFQLKELPAKILEAKARLRTLNLAGNHFESLPSFIGLFSVMKQLNLDRNRLTYLPSEIGQLSKLENFSASANRLTGLPDSVANLSNLKFINLSNNQLLQFPTVLCQMSHLEVLDLSANRITCLPPGIERLSVLELNLNQNQISDLPSELADCPRIKILRVEENCLPLEALKADNERLLKDSNISLLAINGNLFDMKDLQNLRGYEAYMERFTATKKKMG